MSIEIIKQLNYDFDLDKAKLAVMKILEEHNFIPQIGLTHSPKATTAEEKILESTGSIFDFDNKEFKFKETDFTVFNDAYKGTYLYEMYKSMPNIGRFRIMTMSGPSTYYAHSDISQRLHYAVETNKDCIFLFPEIKQQLFIPQDGFVYQVDTRHRHTFVNASKATRIHLLLSLFP